MYHSKSWKLHSFTDEFNGCLCGRGGRRINRWVEISRKALYLDRDDFLPSGYMISAKFRNVVPSSARSAGGPHSTARVRRSDRSQPSPAKKRKRVVIEEVHVLSEDDSTDEDYIGEEDKEDQDEEDHIEEEDDIGVEDVDPIEDIATSTYRQSEGSPECRPSFGMPPSRDTPGASSSIGQREKMKERDPMASVMQTFSTMMVDSQRKHEQQMAEMNARQDRERLENMKLHKESWKLQQDNSAILLEQQKTTQFLLAALMNMNPEMKIALPTACPSPPLLLGSVASGSIVSRSNSHKEEAVGRVHSPTIVNAGAVKDWTSMSSALHGTDDVVTRAETGMPTVGDDGGGAKGACVMAESPRNLERDALEVEVGSDELGFLDGTAGDT